MDWSIQILKCIVSIIADFILIESQNEVSYMKKIAAKVIPVIFMVYAVPTNDVSNPEDKIPASQIEAPTMKGKMATNKSDCYCKKIVRACVGVCAVVVLALIDKYFWGGFLRKKLISFINRMNFAAHLDDLRSWAENSPLYSK